MDLLGDAILAIDYNDITLISDTGRSLQAQSIISRERVDTSVFVDFNSSCELIEYLQEKQQNKFFCAVDGVSKT